MFILKYIQKVTKFYSIGIHQNPSFVAVLEIFGIVEKRFIKNSFKKIGISITLAEAEILLKCKFTNFVTITLIFYHFVAKV